MPDDGRSFACGSGHAHPEETEARACDHGLSHAEGEIYSQHLDSKANKVQPGRLKDAREYLGFSLGQAADALGWAVTELARLEEGGTVITGEQVRRLSRLYRRPWRWFTGEVRFEPGEDFLRKLEGLSDDDREAMLDFAEFLQGAGPPAPRARRADG